VKRASVSLTVIISAIVPPSQDNCGHEKRMNVGERARKGRMRAM